MNDSPFAIGVSGHQDLGDAATQMFVAEQIRAVLSFYHQQEPHLVVYSALARGADQLVVRIALELGIAVEIIIPCQDYEQIYDTPEAREDYRQLLESARHTHHLAFQACSDEAFLLAGQWIVEQSHLMMVVWNGLPPLGKGGTGDVVGYAHFLHRPFIHINPRHHQVTRYEKHVSLDGNAPTPSPKKEYPFTTQALYQGPVLSVQRYHIQMPDGEMVVRDIIERAESLLVVPQGQQGIVLLIEEYNLGAGLWQLTLPGGKIEGATTQTLHDQVQQELRQETGYKAATIEALLQTSSHPGYLSHTVHLFVASGLEWDPLERERHEEIRVRAYPIKEALTETMIDHRFDPEAAFALWMYAQKYGYLHLVDNPGDGKKQ